MNTRLNRRSLLAAGAAATGVLPQLARAAEKPMRPRIAAVVTEYRDNSHADVIVTKFLEGCKTLDLDYRPKVDIVSLYLDQTPPNDLGHEMARKHGVKIFPTIAEALRLGTTDLAVDGVLLIGEHGRYPYNEQDQHQYPRRRFFDETAAVMRQAGRSVPVFNDKHLAYAWADAHHIYQTARELKIPFLAGSSVPLAWRKPEAQLPLGAELTEAVGIGYGGTEAYGFHALEALQCMAERRKGGETGVKSVHALKGDAVWAAAKQGQWSWDLLRAALSRSEQPAVSGATPEVIRAKSKEPEVFLVEYGDGFRGAILMLYGLVEEFLFAGRIRGQAEPLSTLFWLQEGKPFGHFARLDLAIEQLFLTGTSPVPIERTLLTTGILDAAMQSRFAGGERRATPELAIRYSPAAGA